MFAYWVLNLRTRGDISLIRSCRNCQCWFYAVTNHQTYCSDRCRQRFQSRDKSFKEKRRLYMRRYRKDEKARNSAVTQLLNKSRGSPKLNVRAPRKNNRKDDTYGGLQTNQGF